MSILLLAPVPELKSNDASISKYKHPPPYTPGPYHSNAPPDTLPYLPSLPWFCLTKLARFPDQVSAIAQYRLRYQPPPSAESYDILLALIPSLSRPEFDWADVDPRLWATIVQVYDNLPAVFQCYQIPLADEHLRLLQDVQSTPQFSLVTILELPGCPELLDTTIFNLKHLHSLCALDASATSLSQYAIKALSGTVLWGDDDKVRKGPWALRILRLRNCRNIDNKIFPHLSPFQLLSILDLRGTRCHPDAFFPTFNPAPHTEHNIYHPTPLRLSIALLSSTRGLFSSPNVFALHVNALYHPATAKRPETEGKPVDRVTFSTGSSQFFVGSSEEVLKARTRPGRLVREQNPQLLGNCPCAGCVTGTSICVSRRGSVPIRFPDYTLHNDIADQEISAHATKQDILSFYRSESAPSAPRNPSRTYRYPSESPLPPSAKDALLMLYRPPPPWAALQATTPNIQLAKHLDVPAVVTGLSKRKKAEMEQLNEKYAEQFHEKRRRIQELDVPAPSAPETAPLSRNPFRRKFSQQGPLPGASSSSSKPLKPISSIPAPPLTTGAQLKTMKKDTLATDFQPTLPSLMNKQRSITPSVCNSKRDSALHDSGKLIPAKGERKSAAFDWGKWGKK
ncbi:hypothetical protein C8R44DRAFT_802332 [Mycena epipterygia]|nr:hypothetical protein C8R44DRAFT_802332 [Mycena epipterygia]